MDSYTRAYVIEHVHVDAGQRVWCKGVQLKVHRLGSEKKVVLPPESNSKLAYTFDDLKRAGAKVDVVTLKTLAVMGAEGRWKENIEARIEIGLPSNVYVANARTITLALEKGLTPPQATYVGRRRDQITETYETVDEVVNDLALDKFRTVFGRGRNATPESKDKMREKRRVAKEAQKP